MLTLKIEDVSDYPEAKSTDFGFNGEVGVIRNEDNQVIGFYTIDVDDPAIELQELEIVEEFQRKGYGKEFIAQLFQIYTDCQVIEGKSLEDAVSFYASLDNVAWYSTCDSCSQFDCCHNIKYEGTEIDSDTCDDYSENLFKIRR